MEDRGNAENFIPVELRASITTPNGGQFDMQQEIDRKRVERLATAFLTDRVGLDRTCVASLLAVTPDEMDGILAGRGAPEGEPFRRINALVATQSLLLSAYTPDSAVRWMREDPITSDGLAAVDVLRTGAPEAIGIVLNGAYQRMAS